MTKKVIEATKTLQDFCNWKSCYGCDFEGKNGVCHLSIPPAFWKTETFKEEPEEAAKPVQASEDSTRYNDLVEKSVKQIVITFQKDGSLHTEMDMVWVSDILFAGEALKIRALKMMAEAEKLTKAETEVKQ